MKQLSWKISDIATLFLGVLGILDSCLLLYIEEGTNFGILFPGVLGILLFLWVTVKKYLENKTIWNKLQPIRKTAYILIILWIISFAAIEGAMFISSHSQENTQVDFAVALGAGLTGNELSSTLLYRMEKALDYLQKNPGIKIIVAGGGFGTNTNITEGRVMKQFLVSKGIAENRILVESSSRNTMQNLKFSRSILLNAGITGNPRIMIITSDFHLMRSKMLAKRNGFIPYGIPAKTPTYILPNFYVREYFAVIKSFLLDR